MFPIEDLSEFIQNKYKNIRSKLFLRYDFFSHLSIEKRIFLVKQLIFFVPFKKFSKTRQVLKEKRNPSRNLN